MRTIKRHAQGYRDLDYFMLRIKGMHQDIYAIHG
ncbi:hypothetical protein K5X82_01170 [Halosquirtibacter xylanolyticus]|nr:hypothetical protein K5X82_01170 [Prolixibacteraceae bacterium]